MKRPLYSFIVPVFNRPQEIDDLLDSMTALEFDRSYEIVIVEDGSVDDCEAVVKNYKNQLKISYYKKKNTGPGSSRNYGMQRAQGNYFIILDSDCLLPPHYLKAVDHELSTDFVHCFGGPDAAHESFTTIQKAINFTMTSFWTTGGIRGNKTHIGKFQPRSFNMGLSKHAFKYSGGFGRIHPGEDPDLTFRIWKKGWQTRLFTEAFVYHKRRINWQKFHQQIKKFGMVRPILNKWHPQTVKLTYWIPTFFSLGFVIALSCLLYGVLWPITLFGFYFISIFFAALVRTHNIIVALWSIYGACVQFFSYGYGFLKSTILINLSNKEIEAIFPKLFFKTA